MMASLPLKHVTVIYVFTWLLLALLCSWSNVEEAEAEFQPAWAAGRQVLSGSVEGELKTSPFETYPMTRGQMLGGLFGSTLKVH